MAMPSSTGPIAPPAAPPTKLAAALQGALLHLLHITLAAGLSALLGAITNPEWVKTYFPILAPYTAILAALSSLIHFGNAAKKKGS